MTETGEAPAAATASALLALQDEDLHADQLRHQMVHHPALLGQREIEVKQKALAARRTTLDAQFGALEARRAAFDDEVQGVERRTAAIEARLRSDSSGSFRDQGAMAEEIASLSRRKSELEDEELAVMEESEPVEKALAAIAASDEELAGEHTRLAGELQTALGSLRIELAEIEGRRAQLAGEVPERLLAEYERLREHLGGIGAARVVRGACSGCNLALSSTELDQIRHAPPGSISHCEQCGRILFP